MREMVAVMGKRESEGEEEGAGRRAEGMFTTGNEYDILGEGEGSLAYRQRMEGEGKPQPKSSFPSVRCCGYNSSSGELRNWGGLVGV